MALAGLAISTPESKEKLSHKALVWPGEKNRSIPINDVFVPEKNRFAKDEAFAKWNGDDRIEELTELTDFDVMIKSPLAY